MRQIRVRLRYGYPRRILAPLLPRRGRKGGAGTAKPGRGMRLCTPSRAGRRAGALAPRREGTAGRRALCGVPRPGRREGGRGEPADDPSRVVRCPRRRGRGQRGRWTRQGLPCARRKGTPEAGGVSGLLAGLVRQDREPPGLVRQVDELALVVDAEPRDHRQPREISGSTPGTA